MSSCAHSAFLFIAQGGSLPPGQGAPSPKQAAEAAQWLDRLALADAHTPPPDLPDANAMEIFSTWIFYELEALFERAINGILNAEEGAGRCVVKQKIYRPLLNRLFCHPTLPEQHFACATLNHGLPEFRAHPLKPKLKAVSSFSKGVSIDLITLCRRALSFILGRLNEEMSSSPLRQLPFVLEKMRARRESPQLPRWALAAAGQANFALDKAKYELFTLGGEARVAARLAERLYPAPIEGEPAARLTIRACQPLTPPSNQPLTPLLLAAFEQAPAAMRLSATLGPHIAPAFSLDPDSPGIVKAKLKSRFGLSNAGWSWLLVKTHLEPEFCAIFANSLSPGWRMDSPITLNPGYYRTLPNGTSPSPVEARIFGLCRLASICAERSLDCASTSVTIPRLSSSLGSSSPFAPGDNLDWHLFVSPRIWRVEATDLASPRGLTRSERNRKIKKWNSLCLKAGLPRASPLNPAVFISLGQAQSEMATEDEKNWLAAHETRSAYEGVCDAMVGCVLARAIALGPLSPRWDQESQSFMDWISQAESSELLSLGRSPSWREISRAVRLWHENPVKHKGATLTWKPLEPGELDCGEGFSARELTSSEELSVEGARLSHCVGSYAKQCARGESRVFSIRLGDSPSSTLELRPLKRGRWETGFSIAQHRGVHNTRVSIEHELAGERLVGLLSQAIASPATPPIGPGLFSVLKLRLAPPWSRKRV